MTCRPPEPDPRRAEHNHLPPHRKNVLVLDPAERTCTKTRARDDRVHLYLARRPKREDMGAAFGDLLYVLHHPADGGSAFGQEA